MQTNKSQYILHYILHILHKYQLSTRNKYQSKCILLCIYTSACLKTHQLSYAWTDHVQKAKKKKKSAVILA